MKHSNAELNRLLSGRDGLTAVDEDEVLEEVLRRSGRPSHRAGGALRWLWAALVPVAASVALWVWVAQGELTARGTAAPEVHFSCGSSKDRPCRAGETLAFRVSPAGQRYFSAWARGVEGAIIWYFEDLDVSGAASLVLSEGVVLGPEQPPGAYALHAVFSEQRLGKERLRRADETLPAGSSHTRFTLQVVP